MSSDYEEAVTEQSSVTPANTAPQIDIESIDTFRKIIVNKSDWKHRAIDVGTTYNRVYDLPIRGLYRVSSRSILALTDAYVTVKTVSRPHVKSKKAFSDMLLTFTNAQGVTKEIRCNDESMKGDDLYNKLKGFASYPTTETYRKYFVEAVGDLSRSEGTIQDNAETLGWNSDSEHSLQWVMLNGCETLEGFIDDESSEYKMPSDLDAGHLGYNGESLTLPIDVEPGNREDIHNNTMQVWLNEYTTDIETRVMRAALIGTSVALQLPSDVVPDGLSMSDGTLRFAISIKGLSRHGKSRELNILSSIYGTSYRWDTPPMLKIDGSKDSNIGRYTSMSFLKNHLYIDDDFKLSSDDADFTKQEVIYKDTINLFTDGKGGGTTGTRLGGMRNRPSPKGGCIRTTNFDYDLYYAKNPNTENIAARSCTFTWPDNVIGDLKASRYLDAKRKYVYSFGQAYRKWIMSRCLSDKEKFIADLENCYKQADDIIYSNDMVWLYDMHRNQAKVMVFGLFVWRLFLSESLPNSFMIEWADDMSILVALDRCEYSRHINYIVSNVKETNRVDTFFTRTVKNIMRSRKGYIRKQDGNIVLPADIQGRPFSMFNIGYDSRVTQEETELWNTGDVPIGNIVYNNMYFAFECETLYTLLEVEASKKGITIPTMNEFGNDLVRLGIVEPKLDKTGNFESDKQVVTIAGSSSRRWVVKISTLFQYEQDNESVVDDIQYEDFIPAEV